MLTALLQFIGATSIVCFGVVLFAVMWMVGSERYAQCIEARARAEAVRRRHVSESTRIAVEAERIRKWHAFARGRVHHPLGHPVSYATIADLMPRIVSEEAKP